MHHPALRHAPATPLTALLCLVTVVLTAGAAPANAAAPLASTDEEKVTIEIDIKSDDEVTTTFLATAPSDGELLNRHGDTEGDLLLQERDSHLYSRHHRVSVRERVCDA